MKDPIRFEGGFADLLGYHLDHWEEGKARLALDLRRDHMNRSGVLHGGVVTTLIDVACGYAGCFCAVPGNVRRSLTLQLTTQFVGMGKEGDSIFAEGIKLGGGRSVFFARAEVRNQAGLLIGHGEGTFKYRRGSETPDGSPIETP